MRRLPLIFSLALLLLCLALLASLATGAVAVPFPQLLRLLLDRSSHAAADQAWGAARMIVFQLRLPRALSAALVGAGLALAGAVLQALLRNPLAEPFTLGVSGGAAFLVTALAAFAPALFQRPFAAPAAGFLGALLAGGLVFLLAHRHAFSNTALILCGVILSFFFGSLVMVNFVFGRPEAIQSAMIWLTGDFSLATPASAAATAIALLLPCAFVFAAAQSLDVLALGEERAICLGLPVGRLRRALFFAAALIAGVCVACAGIIGFVGFLMPHLARLLVGARHRLLLPLSALLGALFLVVADDLARSLLAPIELPVGAFTGVIGAAAFLLYYWHGNLKANL